MGGTYFRPIVVDMLLTGFDSKYLNTLYVDKLKEARIALDGFMQSQGLTGKPDDVANLRGDDARAAFIKHFKEVQRLQTQLDQYTDLSPEQSSFCSPAR